MLDWFRRRWQALEGNVTYQIIALVCAYIVTLGSAAAFKRWAHGPVTNLGMMLWSLGPSLVLLSILFISKRRIKKLNLEISATGGPATKVSLLVKNLGDPVTLCAFCEITGHPNGSNPFPSGEFRLGWGDGTMATKLLGRGVTENILIAEFVVVTRFDLNELVLFENIGGKKKPKASFRWNEHPKESLPSYNCQLRLTADNAIEEKYTFSVGPSSYPGPLRIIIEKGHMFEVL
jgi:hypothetical protein